MGFEDGMAVSDGEERLPYSEDVDYSFVDRVRRDLLSRLPFGVFPSRSGIVEVEKIHDSFYFAGNKKVEGLGSADVTERKFTRLPLNEEGRSLCFQRIDDGSGRYCVYVDNN